jgi:branched-chain amino acid transport system substrate-binding protein
MIHAELKKHKVGADMKTRFFAVILSLVMLVASGACRKKQAVSKEPIKVGIVLPLTGKHARFGEIEKQSFEMAAEEINAAGGINGRKLDLLIEDTQGKPDVGRSAVEKLITQDKVVMIGGGYSSSVTYAAAGVAVNKEFPFLVNTGSADRITEPKAEIAGLSAKADSEAKAIMDRFSIFRLNPPVSEYTSGLEGFLSEVVKPETAVILHENSLFGTKGASAYEKSCKKLGITVLMKESYNAGAVDFKPLLAKVKAANPDTVFMISYLMEASLLMNESMELKMNPKLFAGAAAGFTHHEFTQNAGKASEKVVSATLWHESLSIPGAREYYDNFLKKFNKPTEYHGAEAYSAAYVIADVLGRAKSHSPQDIRKALSETDMMTVFGPVKFTSYGKKINQNRLETYVVQWINGKLEMIWPKDLAKVKYVYPIDWVKERQ